MRRLERLVREEGQPGPSRADRPDRLRRTGQQLPAERILVYADMFNLPPADKPVPDPPVVGTQVFLANIERLGLDPERIMSIHSLNPDRLTSVADIRASLGR